MSFSEEKVQDVGEYIIGDGDRDKFQMRQLKGGGILWG